MGHSCVENYIHLIFATKHREDLIVSAMESRLHSYLGGIARQRKSPVTIVNGTTNHIHLLLLFFNEKISRPYRALLLFFLFSTGFLASSVTRGFNRTSSQARTLKTH